MKRVIIAAVNNDPSKEESMLFRQFKSKLEKIYTIIYQIE